MTIADRAIGLSFGYDAPDGTPPLPANSLPLPPSPLMTDGAPEDLLDVTLDLISADLAPSAPTRGQLAVELHAARSQIQALRALVTAQSEHIETLVAALADCESRCSALEAAADTEAA